MKPLFTVFIFTVFLEVQRTCSYQEIGDVIFNYDETQNEPGNTFQKNYGGHILEISQLNSEQIESMIPHLEAIIIAAKENPISTVFQYIQELCVEYKTLKSFNKVTNNIENFVTESGHDPKREISSVKSNPPKVFSATSINNNSEEIKATFDGNDPNIKKENALKDRDEKLKKAERKRTGGITKAQADFKKDEEEMEQAKIKVQQEYEKAYVAADGICTDAIKKAEDDIKNAEKEYDEIRQKADEMLKEANDDYDTVTKTAEEDFQEAVTMADEDLEDAEIDYNAAIAKGEKQLEDAQKRAAAKRQISVNQYEAALNGKLTDKIRNTIEKTMNKAEVTYQQALNRANSEWQKVQAEALKEWTSAQKQHDEAKGIAQNEANVTYVKAEKFKEKALQEHGKMLAKAQNELYKKEQQTNTRKEKACNDERYIATAKADKVRAEAIKRLENQWIEKQNLAEQNLERIEQEYQEDIETIMQEYHDAWNRADELDEAMEKMMISQNKESRKAEKNKKNGVLGKKKQQQESRSTNQNRRKNY